MGDMVFYLGVLWYPNNGESNGKENGNEMETAIIYGVI